MVVLEEDADSAEVDGLILVLEDSSEAVFLSGSVCDASFFLDFTPNDEAA